MNYERDIHIDETALDVELLEQAGLAIKYGEYWAQCNEEFVRAEENVKVVFSELILAINSNPEKYLGDVKQTDAKVEAAVRVHPKHIEAKERWITAMTNKNNAEIVKNEISFTRKTALEVLADLYGQNYFAGPSVPRNLKAERERKQEKRKENNARVRINKH